MHAWIPMQFAYCCNIPLPSPSPSLNLKIAEMNTEFGKYLLEEIASCSPHSTVSLTVVRIGLYHPTILVNDLPLPFPPSLPQGIQMEGAGVVPLSLHLVYKDLCSSQPTRVQCSSTGMRGPNFMPSTPPQYGQNNGDPLVTPVSHV